MGGGVAPGSRTVSAAEGAIDDGTLPRIGSPAPGAIGLGGKGGGTQARSASIGESVVSYASRSMGQRVGDGECFALADRALATPAQRAPPTTVP